MAYRTKPSHFGNTPEARARQLANLKQNKPNTTKPLQSSPPAEPARSIASYKDDPIGFIESYFYIPEGRKLIVLTDEQKQTLRDLFLSDPKPNLAVIGKPKKTGKSAWAAAIALWFLVTKPMSEIYLLANSAGQSQLVCFDKLIKAIRMNPALRDVCSLSKERIEYKESFAMILAPNTSVAGINPSLIVAEELWSWTAIDHRRAWDELTNTPTREENLNLVTSYAGWSEDEGSILWDLYSKGMKQKQGEEEKDERFYFRWHGIELYKHIPWVHDDYLKQQKRRMSENTFKRMHCNEWASGIEVFISPETIDLCITDKQYRPGARWVGDVAIGVDLGYRHDCSGIAVTGRISERKYILLDHRLFVPPEGGTLNIENTIEKQLMTFAYMYNIAVVYFDPFQMIRSAQALSGLPMVEFPQTANNCVLMTETLLGLLKNQCLQLYHNSEVRQHLLAANVRESSRGYRLVKRRQSQKIDLTTAIALSVQGAVDQIGPGGFGGPGRREQGPRQMVAEMDYELD